MDYENVNEGADAKAAETVAVAAKTKTDDLKWLMSSPRGRRITHWLLSEAGVYRSSFHNSGSIMAFNEGRRDLGLKLMAEVTDASPEGFDTMLAEQRKKNA